MNFKRSAKFLRNAIEESGYTQRHIAQKLGFTTQQYLSNAVRGKCSVSPEHYKALAKILRIDPFYFFDAYVEDHDEFILKKAGLWRGA